MSHQRFVRMIALLCLVLSGLSLAAGLVQVAQAASLTVAGDDSHEAPYDFAFQGSGCLSTVTVTSTADGGAGSLRQAIADVCDGETIDFAAGLANQTIVLTSAELSITRTVTITNPNAPGLAVSGNNARRVFNIQSSGVATLSQLSVVSGTADFGGGINNYGTLTVRASSLAGNSSANYGGGIFNMGSLTVQASSLAGNSAYYSGGGIFNAGTLTVQASALTGNSAQDGGGIYSMDTLTVQVSSLAGNSASNVGGGIFTNGGTAIVQASTFSGNSASNYYGGGIYNELGMLTVQASTFSGNSATESGGGIYNAGTLALTDAIIANSLSGGDCRNWGIISANDHNLIESTGGDACDLTDGAGGSLIGVDPLLSALGSYGGGTQTFALLPGSPAIDAGANCLAADQRGVARPVGAACDIGAFESRGFTFTYGGGSGQSTPINTTFANPLTLTVASGFAEPVDGGAVTFAGPLSGASTNLITSTATITGGAASRSATANSIVGSYAVTASARGNLGSPVSYNLTNILPAVSLSVSATSGTEAAQTAITVTVTASSTVVGAQTVDLDVSGPAITAGDYSLSSATITIPDGQSSGSVTFTIQDDAVDENDETAILTISNPSAGIALGSSISQTVAIADNDTRGVTLSESGGSTIVSEDGITDTYSLVLTSQPTADVTITVNSGTQAEVRTGAGVYDSSLDLTFTPADWATPKTVEVRAVDDAFVEGDHSQAITHSASGGDYTAFSIPAVTAAIADNDLDFAISANQASVAEGSGSNTPLSFTVTRSGGFTTTAATVDFALGGSVDGGDYQNVLPASGQVSFAAGESQKDITLDVVGDFVVEPDEVLTVTLSSPSGPGSSTLTTPAAQTVIVNDDIPDIVITPTGGLTTTESGGTASFAVRLNSQPASVVTVTLVSADPGEGVVSPAALSFSPANWNGDQTATVTGQDDLLADGDVAYTIQTGITSGDADYSSLDPADVSLTNLDDDVPGYTFSRNDFKLGEGASRVVSVTLGTQPEADVTINLSSSDLSECTVSPVSVTLDAGTWQSGVSFTVGGVKDGVKDGDQPCTIVTGVSTADGVYGSLDPADVTLTVADTAYCYLPLIIDNSAAGQ
jgi:predicted outer membrane repeat protein